MAVADFRKLFDSFAEIKVAVIGDVMLDTYWWGRVDRISPEAPVPVVTVSNKEQRIGGAGNVALNVAALGANVHILSVLGDDDEGGQLAALLKNKNIDISCLVRSKERITTNKIRIISRNQHMMRLDAEVTKLLSKTEEESLVASFRKYIEHEKPVIVILEDYNKGVLTANVIEKIISICRRENILTAVDPKRKNFFAYRYADIFKPNLQEAKEGLNITDDEITVEMLENIHELLYEKLNHHISFITLSEKGIFFQTSKESAIIPTHIRNVADVSGAGDTVIAVASLVYAATRDVRLTAEMSNIAGGLVCEEVGTVAIDRNKFLEECLLLLNHNGPAG